MRFFPFFVGCASTGLALSCLASGGSGSDGGSPTPEGGAGAETGTPPPAEAGATDTGSSPPPADTGTTPPADTGTSAPNGYRVVGPTILDSSGNPHLFHGVDRPSLEWSTTGQWNNENLIPASDFSLMATAWKANVVRISLNQDFWLSGAALYNSSYQATVQAAVTNAEAAGMAVILDLHWSDCGNLGVKQTESAVPGNNNPSISGQQVMGDANSVMFWTQVATLYKGDGHVLFELYNEPNTIAGPEWLNGGNSTGCATVGMQALYNAVRVTAGAQNLVLIGGLSYAYDLSVVAIYPVVGSNIIYATHPYNEYGKQMAANSGTGDMGWDAAFGYLTSTVPVMITEFGDTTSACGATYSSEVIA